MVPFLRTPTAICTMASFYYYDQNPFRFSFDVLTWCSQWGLNMKSPSLHIREQNSKILVIVVKWLHHANKILQVSFILTNVKHVNETFIKLDHSLPKRGWCFHRSHVWRRNPLSAPICLTVGWNWEGRGKYSANTIQRGSKEYTVIQLFKRDRG